MQRHLYLLLLSLLLLATACTTRTYYIVRHADRDGQNDALTPAGQVRTRVLADSLRRKGITHIFSTNTARTRQTATPLSQATGIAITLYGITTPETQQDTLRRFAQHLNKHNRCLVVGHSNTIVPIVQALGATPTSLTIGHAEFDRLFIVRRTKKWPAGGTQVRLEEARYGAVAH